MTATPPDSRSLIERLRDEAALCRNETAEDVARLLDEAADALTASEKDAARWRHARKFIATFDIDEWERMAATGHKPAEDGNAAADAAVDAILAKETTK